MDAVLRAIESSPFYTGALLFFAFYPIVSSVMWTTTATIYFFRREARSKPPDRKLRGDPPRVSILIPTYCEEAHIQETLEACVRQEYPNVEIVVVDDASTDRTIDLVMPFVHTGQVRLIAKEDNEGKAMALNDAIHCLTGEIVFILDADASPAPDALRHIVPHFAYPRVAAVTANPRVQGRESILAKLQTIEFTSIVSVLRRAQRVWGRVLTVSGVATAFRVSALLDVGLFQPNMATEDIDVTWSLQERHYDVRYESGAVVWMHVPRSFRALWGQRRRWATGLAQVLRRHWWKVMSSWKERRMWPVATEATLSILWAYCFVGLTVLWTLSYALGRPPAGASPIPNWWGMAIATLSLVQLLAGTLMDRKYDPTILRYFPIAVFYPIAYWMLMAVITVRSTPAGLLRSTRAAGPARWRTPRREAAEPAPSKTDVVRPLSGSEVMAWGRKTRGSREEGVLP